MFNELKEVKYLKEISDFKGLKMYNSLKKQEKKAAKRRSVFKNQASIYGGAFL